MRWPALEPKNGQAKVPQCCDWRRGVLDWICSNGAKQGKLLHSGWRTLRNAESLRLNLMDITQCAPCLEHALRRIGLGCAVRCCGIWLLRLHNLHLVAALDQHVTRAQHFNRGARGWSCDLLSWSLRRLCFSLCLQICLLLQHFAEIARWSWWSRSRLGTQAMLQCTDNSLNDCFSVVTPFATTDWRQRDAL